MNRYISDAVRKARKTHVYFKRSFSAAARRSSAARGHALSDGSYPIENTRDLANAARLAQSGHGNVAGAKRLIARRAKELGVASPLGKRGLFAERPLPSRIDLAKAAYGLSIEALKDDEIRKKLDLKDGIVWGWASVIEKDGKAIVDHQGDVIQEDDLVKAAHDHVTNSRVGGALHLYVPGPDRTPLKGGDIVESLVFTKALQKALGVDLGKVGWLVGYQITDPYVKKMVASGQLKAFSIGGSGRREPIRA